MIFARLAANGGAMYGGEAVTQLQHALQCATFARDEGASATLIAAALLHDYGHVMGDAEREDSALAAEGIDTAHEHVAAAYLERWFPPEVTEPIRFHVPAKRYLCAVDPAYFATLSPASVQSLDVQGGVFTADEADAFIAQPHADDAVRLRRWDDLAKDPAAETPRLEVFRPYVEDVRLSAG
ncbi:MAG: phosphonate degradation HD-domain oxygenase [Pseudomonadota bacterium]